ncbi:MAG: leucine-rich repeat protein [Bacteroidaceae bacterium]|nr:leucine-rich repeat protein [Bacteroidaceae bacterium]
MMKKNLFLFALLCAYCTLASAWSVTFSSDNKTAYIVGSGNDSQNWSNDSFTADERAKIAAAETLVFSGTINTLKPFDGAGCVATTVDFSDAYFPETTPGAGPFTFYEYAPNSSVTPKYSPNTTSPGTYVQDAEGKYIEHANVYYKTNEMTFQYFNNVTNPILSTHVESICQNCINNLSSLTTTFTIPSNIKFLASGAVDNTPITSLVIPASVEYIQTGAVRNARTNALIAVTVESISTVCANGGFLKDITVGQTDAGYMNYAVLSFPEGAEEYFVNQNHELTLEVSLNKGMFQAWLDQHYSHAGNGWQEFINSSSGDPEPLPNPVVLRTFSDNVAHYVPLCYRAYIVNGVEGNSTDGYTLMLQETFAIPANTGVIIYGESATGSFALPILSGASWQNTAYDRTARTTTSDNKRINLQNFLVPSTTSDHLTVAVAGPYDTDAAKENVLERNFIMTKYRNTTLNTGDNAVSADDDYVGFFRVLTKGTLAKNLAYLKLPSDENTFNPTDGVKFVNPQGMEIIVDNTEIEFRTDKWHNAVSTGNWGQRPSSLPTLVKSIGEPGEEEYFLSVNSLEDIMEENGTIYTLQGVKVTNPQKGIYIKNGKKFIVK